MSADLVRGRAKFVSNTVAEENQMPIGSENGRSRLTRKRAEVLREYYRINKRPLGAPRHYSWVTPAEIARKVGMATSTINALLKGQIWK